MSSAKKIGLGVAGVALVVIAGGYLLPAQTRVERSVEVQAPVKTVYHLVNNLQENEKWSPWKDQDSTLKTTYSSQVEGVGASSSWDGEKMKTGSMTITDAKENESIVLALDFGSKGKAQSSFAFEGTEKGTKVTWSFVSDNGRNPIKRYMGALVAKNMIGKAFDHGLENLKRVSEENATAQQPAQGADAASPAAATN
jgi:hypothetical protein